MTTDTKAPAGKAAIKPKTINEWTSEDVDCPRDIVINAGNKPLILAALADAPKDSARINVGERRQGAYYVNMLKLHTIGHGLQLVAKLPIKRLKALEKIRAIREGDKVEDWVEEVWAKKGKEPAMERSSSGAAEELARLARGGLD